MPEIELFQFQGSPFNEKARWALDWKGLAHERISLLPGPHVRTIQKLSGQAKTPVLRYAGQVVPGSAQIIDTLETRHPAPPLYPADASQRARALEIQREFDEEVGPAVRCAKFFEVMDPAYVKQVFAHHRSEEHTSELQSH